MAKVELYRTRDFLGPVDTDEVFNHIARRRDEEVERIEGMKTICGELGLRGQVDLFERRIKRVEPELREEGLLDASHYYPEFLLAEKSRWNLWAPHGYDLEGYGVQRDYQCVPEQVLMEIAGIQGFKFFERMQVMSYDEPQSHEALLIGYVGNRMFRIARWGERLRPLKNVFRYVKIAETREWWRSFVKKFVLYMGPGGFTMFLFACATALVMWLFTFISPLSILILPSFVMVRDSLSSICVIIISLSWYCLSFNMQKFLNQYR